VRERKKKYIKREERKEKERRKLRETV